MLKITGTKGEEKEGEACSTLGNYDARLLRCERRSEKEKDGVGRG